MQSDLTSRIKMKRSECSRAISWSFFRACIRRSRCALYLPWSLHALCVDLAAKLSIVAVAGLFALGILLWTLIEYLIHRTYFITNPRPIWGNGCITLFTVFITIIQTTHAARDAAKHQHPARVSFLWSFPSDFLAPGAWRVCRIGFWLRLAMTCSITQRTTSP